MSLIYLFEIFLLNIFRNGLWSFNIEECLQIDGSVHLSIHLFFVKWICAGDGPLTNFFDLIVRVNKQTNNFCLFFCVHFRFRDWLVLLNV